jgi:dihydroflavonol-4-reductase
MKIGLTGGTGFTGYNILLLLRENRDFNLRLLLRREPEYLAVFDYEKATGDLNDIKSLKDFCKGMDVIIHLAAAISIESKNDDLVMQTNYYGTKNLINAAKEAGVKRFIHFSSIHALQHRPLDSPMTEERPLALDSPLEYERTKAMGEEFVLQNNSEDFETVVLNPTAIIGPNDHGPSLIGQMIRKISRGKLPAVVPGGYDWVDVRDVSRAAVNAITTGKPGERYILSGRWLTIARLSGMIRESAGKKGQLPVLPLGIAYAGVPFIKLYSAISGKQALYTPQSLKILQEGNRNISNAKAIETIDFKIRPTEESVKDAVEWFLNNK